MHYSAEADATDSLTADSLKPLMKAETDRVRGLVESALAKGNDIRMFSSNMADCDLIRDQNPDVFALVDKKIEAVFVETSVAEKNVQALIEGARSRGANVKIGGKLFSDAMGAPAELDAEGAAGPKPPDCAGALAAGSEGGGAVSAVRFLPQ